MAETQGYTVGAGEVLFDKFVEGTTTGTGFRKFGNVPNFSLSGSEESLDHYNSRSRTKEKDATMQISTDNSFAITTDAITTENHALWFLGSKETVSVGVGTNVTQEATVGPDTYVQLGMSDATPQGVGNLNNVTLAKLVRATGALTFSGAGTAADTITINSHVITLRASGATGAEVNIGGSATATAQAVKAYINAHPTETGVTASGEATVLTLVAIVPGTAGNSIGTTESGTSTSFGGSTLSGGTTGSNIAASGNWEVDLSSGLLHILPNALNIEEGDVITVEFDIVAQTVTQVVSGGKAIFGALMFKAANRYGNDKDCFIPYCRIAPTGDYSLIGDDWQTLNFNGMIMKLPNRERFYWTHPNDAP